MAEEDVISQILKFDPGAGAKPKPAARSAPAGGSDSVIDEILQFDPGRVGGIYQPKKSDVPGAVGPEISAITGKPVSQYMPGDEPGAAFSTMLKASFVDEPQEKIGRFAKGRGIPADRYKLDRQGNIIFKNSAGNWQREVGELGITKLKELAAQTTGHPGTYLSAVGAVLGPYGAAAGAGAGELARQFIGAYLYGGHADPTKNVLNIVLETAFAFMGEGAGKAVNSALNRIKRKGVINTVRGRTNPLTTFGRPDELGMGILKPEEHAKAALVKTLAERHGIDLAPHQLYDKAGMRDVWAYLRKHPATADAVHSFEKNLSGQSEKALDNFIRDLGGYNLTPTAAGARAKTAAEKAIDLKDTERTRIVGPIYEQAMIEAEQAGGVDISNSIGMLDNMIKYNPEGPAKKALERIKKSLGTEDINVSPAEMQAPGINPVTAGLGTPPPKAKPEKIFTPETSLRKIQKAIFDLNDLISGTSQEATRVAPSSKKVLNRDLEIVKKDLLAQIEKVSPTFIEANSRYEALSNPIKKLKESVVGEITRIRSEKGLSGVPGKLFASQSMPDAALLAEAKRSIEPQDPELWNKLVGGYIRDVYEGAKATEQGEVKNIAGKMYKKLAGSQKQRDILNVALGPKNAKAFTDLMEVFQRASVGMGRESSETWMFGKIDETMAKGMGSKLYQLGTQKTNAIANWAFGAWDDVIQRGQLSEYFEALTSKDNLRQIKKIKAMTPGSRRMIESLAVFTSGVLGTAYGEDMPGSSSQPMPGAQRMPQGQGQ